MHLKIKLLLKTLFLCFIARSNILSQANQDASETNGQTSSYFFYQLPEYPRDCKELAQQCSPQNQSNAYLIKPDGYLEPFLVYCEDEWTIILRRVDGFVNFYRDWAEYDKGFGFLNVDFWLGNEKLSYLTNQKEYELVINFETKTGDLFYVTYNMFRISDKFSNYTLVSIGDFTGTLGSFITWCPANMIYGNCRCQTTCADPIRRDNCNCPDDDQVCFCPDDFMMDGDDCIPQEDCGCYLKDVGVIPEGENYVNSDCSQRCDCQAGTLTCVSYQCHTDATCQDEDGVRQCSCNDGYRGDGQTCTRPSIDCYDLQQAGNTASGDYTINPVGWPDGPFTINCNMTIDEGGWTVFQRRIDGTEPFNLGWNSYKEGFGTTTGEFWLGNDKLAFLTNQKDYELRIDLSNKYSNPYYAKYDLFRITDESNKYRLVGLGNYSGNAAYDAVRYHHYQAFSTIDRDNDVHASDNCASYYQSAWWYVNDYCSHCDLNRRYTGSHTNYWYNLPRSNYNIKYTEMKIRPVEGQRK